MPASLSKFCDCGKQHIATGFVQSALVEEKSLNQVLAESLVALMADRWKNTTLGAKAGVAANTIANYKAAAQKGYTPERGEEKSATLANVEKLANALGVSPLLMLMTPKQRAALAIEALQVVALHDAKLPAQAPSAALREALSSDDGPELAADLGVHSPSASPRPKRAPGPKTRAGTDPQKLRRAPRDV